MSFVIIKYYKYEKNKKYGLILERKIKDFEL